MAQPLSQWIRVWTNAINARGNNNVNATLTNRVSSGVGGQFYILQLQ